MKITLRRVSLLVAILAAGFLLLALPSPRQAVTAGSASLPFVWNQDAVWERLEGDFVRARQAGCQEGRSDIDSRLEALSSGLEALEKEALSPAAEDWDEIESELFELAPRVAACPGRAADFVAVNTRLRRALKRQSAAWDLSSMEARRRLYRLLYGGRAAVEEVIVQSGSDSLALIRDVDEPSASPTAVVQGVEIRSGDLLVSRGGFPTSALISRGSDYPGNFSHVALAHVGDAGEVSVIEAHIEVGVTVATAEKYLEDKKLRLMVLRARHDLPQVIADPFLPHKAASYALERARAEHIPYDFEMNYEDPSKLFCSEVGSEAYGRFGVTLWAGISTISSQGLRAWLAALGVRYFKTQEPSDLEYDPQLVVVAEWRDAGALLQARVDNAVVDVMLEGAESGDRLEFPWYQLPVARLAKGFSLLANLAGKAGPVPEGMSSEAALRSKAYSKRHDRLANAVVEGAAVFSEQNGYQPPYWRLVELAREAAPARSGSPASSVVE